MIDYMKASFKQIQIALENSDKSERRALLDEMSYAALVLANSIREFETISRIQKKLLNLDWDPQRKNFWDLYFILNDKKELKYIVNSKKDKDGKIDRELVRSEKIKEKEVVEPRVKDQIDMRTTQKSINITRINPSIKRALDAGDVKKAQKLGAINSTVELTKENIATILELWENMK